MSFFDISNVAIKELGPGLKARFLHSEKMTVSYWNLSAGAVVPRHAHPHEQIANIIEGEFEMTVDGQTRLLEPGEGVIIAPHMDHSGIAKTDCRIIDVFYPVREDYRQPDDHTRFPTDT